MADGRRKDEWNRTADLLAHLANLQRADTSSPIWIRSDFHPFLQQERKPLRVISDPRELAREWNCPGA